MAVFEPSTSIEGRNAMTDINLKERSESDVGPCSFPEPARQEADPPDLPGLLRLMWDFRRWLSMQQPA